MPLIRSQVTAGTPVCAIPEKAIAVPATAASSINYHFRAETPGRFSALPATIEGMYSPELVGHSDEFKQRVNDRK